MQNLIIKSLFILLLPIMGLLGCSTVSTSATPVNALNCTGIDVLAIRRFHKTEHKFRLKDDGKPAITPIEMIGCYELGQNNQHKEVRLYSYSGSSRAKFGSYVQNNRDEQIFQLFIDWYHNNPTPNNEKIEQINQQLSTIKLGYSTTPKNQADWYVDIEQSTNQPVLVSNARFPELLGTFANHTVALTYNDVKNILILINQYWSN